MSTSAEAVMSRATKVKIREGYPADSLRFDWIVTVLSALFVLGIFIDGWAHNHNKVDNTFFTPWHALLYGGFAIVGAFLALSMGWNFAKGYPLRRALPQGYALSMVGVIIFAFGGVGDLIWHTLFGIEANVDALLSPTHLILALGVSLIATGPLRAAWFKFAPESNRGWKDLGPLVLSATLFLSILMFFTQYSNPLVNTLAANGSSNGTSQGLGVTGILLHTALLIGIVLLLTRHWRLPFGALTVIFTATSLLVATFHDHYELVPSALIAGILADVLLWRLKPSADQPGRYYVFAFAVPVMLYALYFANLQLTQGITWTIHMWAGVIVQAGVVGLLASFLVLLPFGAVLGSRKQ